MDAQIYRDGLLKKIKELKNKISRYDNGKYTYSEEEAYKDFLDEIYPEYKPCGEKGPSFTYSDVLENCDPVMFKQGLEEYYDREDFRQELEDELDRLECEFKDDLYPGWDNEIINEDDEDEDNED